MFDKNEIASYYDEAEVSYRDVWHLNDCLAMHYGFWEEGVKNLKEALIKENYVLANLVKITENDVVLDAGCGVGGSSIFLAKNFGCKVKGVSLSELQCQKAKQNASKANLASLTDFENIDYHYTEYPDGYFTVIWAMETLGYSDDLDLFLKEAFRLLAPGGRIVIADGFARKETYSKEEQVVMDRWLHNWAIGKIETTGFFKNALEENKFQDIQVIDKTNSIKRSSKIMGKYARLALIYGKLLRIFGKAYGNPIAVKNSIGGKYQRIALKKELWTYNVITAVKR